MFIQFIVNFYSKPLLIQLQLIWIKIKGLTGKPDIFINYTNLETYRFPCRIRKNYLHGWVHTLKDTWDKEQEGLQKEDFRRAA
jgi:hypothetical protein